MTTILIVEGNLPASVARGASGAKPFMATLAALAPQVSTRIAAPYAMPLTVHDLDGITGVIFTGSGEAWSVDAPEAAPLRAAMRVVFDAGLPVWGSCNGMQLGAVILGGAVGASPNGLEAGLARDIQLTHEGHHHPMMAGRAPGFAAPCVHRDEVQALPHGMRLIATNAHSPVQAVAYEQGKIRFWGTQYHPELSPAGVAAYLRDGAGIFTDCAALIPDLERAEDDAEAAARLGAGPGMLEPGQRAAELTAWLTHIGAVQDLSLGPSMGYEQPDSISNRHEPHEIHAFLAEKPPGHDRDTG